MLILATINRRILYLSHPYCGAVHDFSMMKSEFNTDTKVWFDELGVYVDLGFLGIEKEYNIGSIHIPFKKPRRKSKKDPIIPLTPVQKEDNRIVSKTRIRVEHSIGGLKRYRFLSDRLRCRDEVFYSRVAGICAGLWNFQLTT